MSFLNKGRENGSANPGRVLVVDDEKDVAILFRQMFRREIREGTFEFTFVANGVEALNALEANPHFDLMLSDIRMPNMDGLVLLSKVNARYPLIKTVMVTAYGDMENIRRAMNSGAFDFVSKPIQYKDLKVTIVKTLDHVREIRSLHQAKLDKERAQARLVAELRKLNRLKDEFLATTSHELKTPLNGMIGLLESLIEETETGLPNETVQYLSLALSSGKRLGYLINDILDYSKIKNEELFLYQKPVNLASLVNVVMTFSQALVGNKPLVLKQNLEASLPKVFADEDRLEQIFFNLVGNAVKFTEEGEVCVSASLEGERVRVAVSDTGKGIAPQNLERIFEAYQQGDLQPEAQAEGSGLGLSITKRLVAMHGGELTVASEVGKGTVFSFSLRAVVQPAEDEQDVLKKVLPLRMPVPESSEPADPSEPAEKGDKPRQRILVVDDDPLNIQVLRRQLKDYDLTVAENGAKALSIIDASPPFDLLVLDIMMPVISGYKLCQILRQRFKAVELPILLLTARNQVSDLVEGLEAGANDFLTKPLSKRELLARVRTHLELVTVNRQLKAAQDQALMHARAAGKAEFATTVLHNVGNILNSINISCDAIAKRLSQSRLSGLEKANSLLKENLGQLAEFFSRDERGQNLPTYYFKVGEMLRCENDELSSEIGGIIRRIDLMREIIETQQFYANPNRTTLAVDLGIVMDESLAVQSELIGKYSITVEKKYLLKALVPVQQPLLVQVLVNLIKNAIEAMQDASSRVLTMETGRDETGASYCKICDTGEGMEDASQIFQSGYTTKKHGHGYGLYFCRKAVEAMGGFLTATSEGAKKGSCFLVTFTNEEQPSADISPEP